MYERLRHVCCEAWGIPPWEFDAAAEAGRVECDAVLEALRARCASQSPEGLLAWLFPRANEAKQREAGKLDRVKALTKALALARGTKNAQAEAAILKELGEINGR